jgi:hypothetical protein
MRDLVSSTGTGAGEEDPDLPGGGKGSDNLPFGELDREGRSEVTGDNNVEGAELEFWVTEPESRRCGNSSLSGNLVFGTTRGAPGENEGGGLTGAASSGDVMGS